MLLFWKCQDTCAKEYMKLALLQATKEHLSAYLRPLGPAVALQEDGEAAWATALGMGVQDYHLAKQGKIINQSY